jgi:hypothetical protein
MLSSAGFEMSKQKAQLPIGPGGRDSFIYWSDVQRQWEWSYSSRKVVDLIGSQSVSVGSVPDIKALLGELTAEETRLKEAFVAFYDDVKTLLCPSLDGAPGLDPDLYETLLDRRLIGRRRAPGPMRILDIGPGAGRHMVSTFLDPAMAGSVYVGLESVGLPYGLQNAAASLLRVRDRSVAVYDGVDYEYSPEEAPPLTADTKNAIYHLPLWMRDRLPDDYFDLIICSHVLDELPRGDFVFVMDLLKRTLAPGGLVYCRGSQQKAMIRDMYLYGMGTFHGHDITKMFLDRGMKAVSCEMVACQMTRFFAHEGAATAGTVASDGPYVAYTEDEPLVERMQDDFIRETLARLEADGAKVAIWGDQGYDVFSRRIAPHLAGIDPVGVTNRLVVARGDKPAHRQAGERVVDGVTYMVDTPTDLVALRPDVIVVASMYYNSIHRQVKDISGDGDYAILRTFNYPVAFIYRNNG